VRIAIALWCFCFVEVLGIAPEAALAQQPAPPAHLAANGPSAPHDPVLPDEYRVNLMIRGIVIALNQANVTGNYTVLRDLGTPGFQAANNAARLSEIFAPLRARKVDLAPILFFNPKLLTPPAMQEGQVLRLTGFFPTTPEQVNFDLAFQFAAEQWMLAGIGVSTSPPGEAQKGAQVSSLQAPHAPDGFSAVSEAKPAATEAKPVRIDLGEPAALPPKKPIMRKPKPKPVAPAAQATPAPPAAQPASPAVEPAATPSDADRPKSSNVKPDDWQPR